MNYQQAEKIRNKSFGSLLGEQEGGLGTSLKKTLSLKSQARMTGIKEKFDPLNIAKFLTGGSNFAPAALGKLFGRSKEDIARFSGSKLKDVSGTATKIGSLEGENQTLDMLMKIYEFMQKSQEDKIAQRDAENNFAEENKLEKERRHKELIEAITGKKYSGKASATKMNESPGESEGLNFGLNFRINPARAAAKGSAATATKVAGEASKEAIKKSATKQLSKSIGKGALKSIPILGLAIGAGFAISRLIEGDVVGAGIDAASGVGSALTAIPLTLTNAARDVYKDVYGNYPDPTNSQDQKNLSEIYDIVKEIAAELLKNSAVPADNDMQYDALGTAMQGVPMSEEASPVTKTSKSSTNTATVPNTATAPNTAVTPMPSPNMGSQLQSAQAQNLDMQIPVSSKDPSIAINNTTKVSNTTTKEKKNLPAVRNMEETFQRMILYSTRVV